jgi:cytochrome c5
MKKIYVILCVCCFGLLAACSKKLLTPQKSDMARAEAVYPGTTLAELKKGKEIFDTYCGKCHPYKNPQTKTQAQWEKIIPPMAKKAKLDANQEKLVLKYVVVLSEKK